MVDAHLAYRRGDLEVQGELTAEERPERGRRTHGRDPDLLLVSVRPRNGSDPEKRLQRVCRIRRSGRTTKDRSGRAVDDERLLPGGAGHLRQRRHGQRAPHQVVELVRVLGECAQPAIQSRAGRVLSEGNEVRTVVRTARPLAVRERWNAAATDRRIARAV